MTTADITSTDTRALYQRFPHLIRIELMWGSVECRQFLSSLLTDDRGEHRTGFPAEHAKTIFSLLMEHDSAFPECELASIKPASHDFYQGRNLR
ncbi:MAG: hypothetical protein H6945_13510 [Zoogloeaceae bacterium]|nr:hypothetical protein [Rhodocyclaceae bacterium]MCP5236744.1 hypothetical protein [Zoogloeaceae bacterium]